MGVSENVEVTKIQSLPSRAPCSRGTSISHSLLYRLDRTVPNKCLFEKSSGTKFPFKPGQTRTLPKVGQNQAVVKTASE